MRALPQDIKYEKIERKSVFINDRCDWLIFFVWICYFGTYYWRYLKQE